MRATLGHWWASCSRAVDATAFPWACSVCDADADSPFCGPCRLELLGAATRSCPRCAMPVGPYADLAGGCDECRGRRLGFDAALALGPYHGPIRHLCLRLKQDRDAWLAPWMAALVAEARGPSLAAEGASCVVPIPLHWRKQLARGYNQADALAAGLARRLGLDLIRPLRRVKWTGPLAGRGRVERREILRDAFAIRPGVGRGLRGRTVVLVDDILTSGATCGAAARAIKKAGAARVVVAVVARAEGRA